MTFLTIGKSGHVLQEQAAHEAGKGRLMGIDRLLPVSLTIAGSVVGTAIVDINWGALAGTIGTGGMAAAAAYFAFMSKKTKAYKEEQAAKLEMAEKAENSRIGLLERESAARLKIQRAEAVARLKLQREQDEANKVSLSARVKELETKLDEKRRQWHDEADRQAGLYSKVSADLWEAKLRVAKLEGQLGVADKIHADAINANIDNINIVAEKTGVPLPSQPPHVDPIVHAPKDANSDVLDPSDDDITPFLRR